MRSPDAEEAPLTRAPLEIADTTQQIRNHGTARRLVSEAATADLAVAVSVPVAEVDAFTLGEVVPCPRCQRSALDLMRHEPAAVDHSSFVECVLCTKVTTRWHLERMVLEDAEALDRLIESLLSTAVTG